VQPSISETPALTTHNFGTIGLSLRASESDTMILQDYEIWLLSVDFVNKQADNGEG